MSPIVLEAPPAPPRIERRVIDRLPPPMPPTGGGDDDGHESAGHRPRLDNVRVAMVFFLSAETMFFAGLVSAFFVLRLAAPVWPRRGCPC
jgi:hypothetical protein